MHDHPLLQKNIQDLPVSESFRSDFTRAGFGTLYEALAFTGDALVTEKEFSYHTLTELINLLDKEGLAKLLKD